MILFDYLTVVPDAASRTGRDDASAVAGRFPVVECFEAVVVDELLAVAGREAKDKEKYAEISKRIK